MVSLKPMNNGLQWNLIDNFFIERRLSLRKVLKMSVLFVILTPKMCCFNGNILNNTTVFNRVSITTVFILHYVNKITYQEISETDDRLWGTVFSMGTGRVSLYSELVVFFYFSSQAKRGRRRKGQIVFNKNNLYS